MLATATVRPPTPRHLNPGTWPQPAEISDTVLLAAMRAEDPASLVVGLGEAIAVTEDAMTVHADTPGRDASDGLLYSTVNTLRNLAARRRAYVERRARIAELAQIDPPPIGPTDAELIASLMRRHAGWIAAADARIAKARVTAASHAERLGAQAERQVADFGPIPPFAGIGDPMPGSEWFGVHNGKVIDDAKTWTDRLDVVLKAESAAETARAANVASVVGEAGNADAVARMCRGARMMRRDWHETGPYAREIAQAKADIADRQADLEQARAAGLAALTEQAKAALDAAKAHLAAVEKQSNEANAEQQAAEIHRAMQGDDAARRCLEALARQVPAAFPAGFADRLAGAAVDREDPTGLVLEILGWGIEL